MEILAEICATIPKANASKPGPDPSMWHDPASQEAGPTGVLEMTGRGGGELVSSHWPHYTRVGGASVSA